MVRHVCGTCRFFQANDPKGRSGWCGHPLKQTTTDVRILVRAGELNCRNDWDKDLWQLREDGDRVLDVSMVKSSDQDDMTGRPKRAHPPRTLGEGEPRVSQPLPPPDDVVIGEELDAPRLVSDDVNREMLRRAREQYRARRLTPRPDGPSPRSGDAPAPPLRRSEPIVISNEVQPLQIGMEPGPDLTRISDRDRVPPLERGSTDEPGGGAFSSVPEVQESVELPRRQTRRPDVIPTVNDFEMDSIRNYDEVIESRAPKASSGRPEERPASRPNEETHEHPVVSWGDDKVDLDDDMDVSTFQTTAETFDEERSSHRSGPTPVGEGSWEGESDDIRPWDYIEPRRSRLSDMDARELVRIAPPSLSRLWDDIPRCCRTCRDFRAAEAGGRGGWCTNRWAFRHRRMVDVDQLTCETTIGDWWLPTDDAWQDDFDVGRHTLSTPLMDKWFGRPEEESEPYYPAIASRTRRRS